MKNKAQYYTEDLPNEKWVSCYIDKNYSVSNLGRLKYNSTQRLITGSITKYGYIDVCLQYKKYFMHRIVLQSFNPKENFENLTVNHINGIRTDNWLENLEWVTITENTQAMYNKRKNLIDELNNLINKYGYDETLKKLKNL